MHRRKIVMGVQSVEITGERYWRGVFYQTWHGSMSNDIENTGVDEQYPCH
jgi:hypothetical protein